MAPLIFIREDCMKIDHFTKMSIKLLSQSWLTSCNPSGNDTSPGGTKAGSRLHWWITLLSDNWALISVSDSDLCSIVSTQHKAAVMWCVPKTTQLIRQRHTCLQSSQNNVSYQVTWWPVCLTRLQSIVAHDTQDNNSNGKALLQGLSTEQLQLLNVKAKVSKRIVNISTTTSTCIRRQI